MLRSRIVAIAVITACAFFALALTRTPAPPRTEIYVDPSRGKDRAPGTKSRPLRSIAAALGRLPDPVAKTVTIHLAAGRYESDTGGLHLAARMRPGVRVRIVGHPDKKQRPPELGWSPDRAMVLATAGHWSFEQVRFGTFSKKQRRGIHVRGPAHVELKDVSFRLRSHSGEGILADRGGRVTLSGKIRLNEHLHDEAGEETFCGIAAFDHGRVKFEQREGAELSLGNGSLSSGYYGVIRLGCARARVTSWTRQSNCLAVNNGGRVDLHGTPITLCAKHPDNTPIGPEHDGHLLGEDATITIVGKNRNAIMLQKASTLFCNDIILKGTFGRTITAMSGSIFVGSFLTDVTDVIAHTGGQVHIGKIDGGHGRVRAQTGGLISMPGGKVIRG